MKKFLWEDVIIGTILLVLIALWLWLLTGCASKQVEGFEVMLHDGECLLVIKDKQAGVNRDILRNMTFENCKVSGAESQN